MASTKRPKRNRGETRELMLEAGAQLVYETFSAPEAAGWAPVAHIRLTEVAVRASEIADARPPITTGAIYPIWEDQNAYRRDLILHLLRPERRVTQELWTQFVELATSPELRPPTVEAMIDLVCRTTWKTTSAAAFYHAHYTVAPYQDPEIAAAVREYFAEERRALVPFYRVAYLAYGVRPATGLTYEDISIAVGGLLDGLIMSHLAGLDDGQGPQNLDLEEIWVRSAAAILLGFSEPVDDVEAQAT